MKIERELQGRILQKLSNVYPHSLRLEQWNQLMLFAGDKITLIANMLYLEENHLLVSGITQSTNDVVIRLDSMRITTEGLDFLLGDGGVNAVLNVTAIRFHDEIIQRLLDFVSQSELSYEDKSRFVVQLKSLPAETARLIVMRLIDQGLARMPDVDVIRWLRTLLL